MPVPARAESRSRLGPAVRRSIRPFGLTSGQFSLLMSLNRPESPAMGQVSALLAMDRTTLTTALKPLERRGYVEVRTGATDKRRRIVTLTESGRAVLAAAIPVWRQTHASIEAALPDSNADRLRTDLEALSPIGGPTSPAPRS